MFEGISWSDSGPEVYEWEILYERGPHPVVCSDDPMHRHPDAPMI